MKYFETQEDGMKTIAKIVGGLVVLGLGLLFWNYVLMPQIRDDRMATKIQLELIRSLNKSQEEKDTSNKIKSLDKNIIRNTKDTISLETLEINNH